MRDPAEKWRGIDKRKLSDFDLARRHADLYGSPTGRLSRIELEYQELPRAVPRPVVDSPLVNVDLSQIEARVLAHMEKKKC